MMSLFSDLHSRHIVFNKKSILSVEGHDLSGRNTFVGQNTQDEHLSLDMATASLRNYYS